MHNIWMRNIFYIYDFSFLFLGGRGGGDLEGFGPGVLNPDICILSLLIAQVSKHLKKKNQ